MKISRILASGLTLAFALAATSPFAQEVKPAPGAAVAGVPKNISVTQQQLTGAAGQAANWLHTNGNYGQTRYFPGKDINTVT